MASTDTTLQAPKPSSQMNANPRPQTRTSARLAAKPRTNYAQADKQLDKMVEEYANTDIIAAKKALSAIRAIERKKKRAEWLEQAYWRYVREHDRHDWDWETGEIIE
jgi:hypothetical protein